MNQIDKSDRVVVIGGGGFVGKRLVPALREAEAHVTVADRLVSEEDICFADLEDEDSLRMIEGSSTIINLAAEHRDDVKPIEKYYDVNVTGAENLCNAARRYGVNQIIFTSSVAVYGFAPPGTDEQGEIRHFNEYGRTKYLAERVYEKWQAEDSKHRSLVIVRPTVIFGPGNRGNVYNLLSQIASRQFLMVGPGDNLKSMAYVDNVAAFLVFSVGFGSGKFVYNYVDGPDFTMKNLVAFAQETLFGAKKGGLAIPLWLGLLIGKTADLIAAISNKSLPVSAIRVRKFAQTTSFKSSISSTGFVPPHRIKDSLRDTIRAEFMD